MRAGAYTIQQTLTAEAASVLKHSLGLARRRGHAQVTPLHVAATLLSSRSSVLRRACLKSQHHHHHHLNSSIHPLHHPLQCRALELCFNVALNRLPTSPSPLLHGCQAALSNALIAALKRAQAHQRRGCVEQQPQNNQQPLLVVKVELEQLVISILDDPSVSRVMREAGFSSSAVKSNIEDSSSSSASPVFHGYDGTTSGGGGGGVFSSPSSPTHADYTLRGESTVIPSPGTFWRTQPRFLAQLHVSPPAKTMGGDSLPPKEDDIKLVIEVMLRNNKRNTVVVGDSRSARDGLATEVIRRVEKGEVPGQLKSISTIKFQFAPLSFRYMKSSDVCSNIAELKRKIDEIVNSGAGAIIYAGDLTWAAEDKCGPVDQLVAEMGKLLSSYLGSPGGHAKVWLVGTADLQTYMRCQKRRPPLEVEWGLQAVTLPSPSAGLGLSLHAQETRPFGTNQVEEVKPLPSKDAQLTCCADCASNFHKESALFSTSAPSQLLPSWIHSHPNRNPHEDQIGDLKVKWNKLCQGLHQETTRNIVPTREPSWRPFQTGTTLPDARNSSLVFADGSPNVVARFRGQQTSNVEFGGSRLAGKNQGMEPNLDYLRNSEGKEVKITLSLGNSLFSDSGKLAEHNIERMLQRGNTRRLLQDNVPWQSEMIPAIVESLFDTKSAVKDTWLLIHGNDTVGKRRLARAIAEALFGASDLVISLNTRARNCVKSSYSEIFTRISKGEEKLVVLVENADLADKQLLEFLTERFETGKTSNSSQGRGQGKGRVVFILTKGDHDTTRKSRETVVHMEARVVKTALSAGIDLKRKADWEIPDKLKVLKTGSKGNRNILLPGFGTFDLNEEAREDAEEVSPNTSDLTGESGSGGDTQGWLLGRIENEYRFNRSLTRDRERKEMFLTRIRGAGEEVYGGGDKVRIKVEEGVLEGIVIGAGVFLNGLFEKWLKETFQTGMHILRGTGVGDGDGDGVSIVTISRTLGLGGGEEEEEGYMNTCLPKLIHIPS